MVVVIAVFTNGPSQVAAPRVKTHSCPTRVCPQTSGPRSAQIGLESTQARKPVNSAARKRHAAPKRFSRLGTDVRPQAGAARRSPPPPGLNVWRHSFDPKRLGTKPQTSSPKRSTPKPQTFDPKRLATESQTSDPERLGTKPQTFRPKRLDPDSAASMAQQKGSCLSLASKRTCLQVV